MDPNAALRAINEALSESPKNYTAAREYRSHLFNWLRNGGFEPLWNRYPMAARYCGRKTDVAEPRCCAPESGVWCPACEEYAERVQWVCM